jgi:antitoxin PrlF
LLNPEFPCENALNKAYSKGKASVDPKETPMAHSTLTRKGQTTIPVEIREALHIKAGDRLEYILEGDKVSLRVHPGLSALKGILAGKKGKSMSIAQIRQAAEAGWLRGYKS